MKSGLSDSKYSPCRGPSLQFPARGASFGGSNTSGSRRLTIPWDSFPSQNSSQAQKALAYFVLPPCSSQAPHSTDGENLWWEPSAKDQVPTPARDPVSWPQ